jgi:hypothetical protein
MIIHYLGIDFVLTIIILGVCAKIMQPCLALFLTALAADPPNEDIAVAEIV